MLKIAEVFEAPLEKLDATAEKIISEYRELRRERTRLMEKISKMMAEKYVTRALSIGGLKLILESVSAQKADVDLLIKIANEIVNLDQRAVVTFICVDKNARAVVRVGAEALRSGVNASEIARKIGLILGGGGSGKPDFAQAGGLKIENVAKALDEAKSIIYGVVGE